MRAIQKMYLLLNLSHYIKRYGHFCQILAFFAMPAHQKSQKVTKFLVEKLCFRSYQPRKVTGVENTPLPVPLGLNVMKLFSFCKTLKIHIFRFDCCTIEITKMKDPDLFMHACNLIQATFIKF